MSTLGCAQSLLIERAASRGSGEPTLQLELALDLGERATMALESGLVLGFRVDWELADGRRLEDRVWLRYSPLLRRYALALGARPQMSFALRNSLLAAVENARLAWPDAAACVGDCGGRARVRLEVSSLPAPLRLPALTSREWRLDSGWQDLAHD